MRIVFKLFATLSDHLPQRLGEHARSGNTLPVDVPAGTSVQAVIDRFNLPTPLVRLVLVNGTYVPPEERASHLLRPDDELAIWPPVAGG